MSGGMGQKESIGTRFPFQQPFIGKLNMRSKDQQEITTVMDVFGRGVNRS